MKIKNVKNTNNAVKISKKFTKGFTLLELLVVVLIIGILAAVALPQYKKAVEKSKASQALALIKSINESIQSYYLTTEHYPTSFDQLDISIPESFDKDEKLVPNNNTYGKSNKDWNISIERLSSGYLNIYIIRISGKYKGAGFLMNRNNKIICYERISGAYYLFDSNLSEGAYCEKIIGATFRSSGDYSRAYSLN